MVVTRWRNWRSGECSTTSCERIWFVDGLRLSQLDQHISELLPELDTIRYRCILDGLFIVLILDSIFLVLSPVNYLGIEQPCR